MDNGQAAFDPTALGPVDKQQRSRGRKGGFELDLGEVLITEGWIVWEGALKNRTRLDLVPADDVSNVFAREAGIQAKRVADAFRSEGYEGRGTSPVWIDVLWTLATRLGSWELAMRVVRAGLGSGPNANWCGWRALLAKDPEIYGLRASFLQAARYGWRIQRGHRWEDGLAWDPATPEVRGAWELWLGGGGEMP